MSPVSHLLGLGFMTSITFIFLVGVFMSSWLGASVLQLGEWFIKKMPLISYIYYALKQISAAINPGMNIQPIPLHLGLDMIFKVTNIQGQGSFFQIRTTTPSRKWPSSSIHALVNMRLHLSHQLSLFRATWVRRNSTAFTYQQTTFTWGTYFLSAQETL